MSAVLQQNQGQPVQGESRDRWEKYRSVAGGLSVYWYPVMTAAALRRKKRTTLTLVGQKLVLFHEQGRFFALQDECPHRQVPLSFGKVEFPGHLTCFYHGWTYSMQTGQMVSALTDGPNSPVAGKASVRTFPVEERIGLVFIWMGEGKPVPVEDDIPAELLRADARIFPFIRRAGGNWRHACENGFDESHLKMVHRYSAWVMFRNVSAWNETSIDKSDDGIWLERVQKNVHLFDDYPGLGSWPKKHFWKPAPSTGVTTGGKDHAVGIRLPCTLRVRQPGKADWTHYEWYVPIDKDSYIYLVLAVSWRERLWKRFTWWFRYWSYILLIHHIGFNSDDLKVVEVTPESAPVRAFRPDVSIFEWRRHVEQDARPVNRGTGKVVSSLTGSGA
jgi:phenylpropionate dioxygenase-like ring-hydroxylating dioxygenase large terminal subunit